MRTKPPMVRCRHCEGEGVVCSYCGFAKPLCIGEYKSTMCPKCQGAGEIKDNNAKKDHSP